MQTGPLGIELIKHFESFASRAYQDSVGVWTIGYGTIRVNGQPVRTGMTCTLDQALQWLAQDIRGAEQDVMRYVRVTLAQHQFDALVSFTYNLGGGALAQSTLCRQLNARGTILPNYFTDWKKARVNGVLIPLAGLLRRRQAEHHLFSTGTLKFDF